MGSVLARDFRPGRRPGHCLLRRLEHLLTMALSGQRLHAIILFSLRVEILVIEQGLGFRVYGLGFGLIRAQGLGFRVSEAFSWWFVLSWRRFHRELLWETVRLLKTLISLKVRLSWR